VNPIQLINMAAEHLFLNRSSTRSAIFARLRRACPVGRGIDAARLAVGHSAATRPAITASAASRSRASTDVARSTEAKSSASRVAMLPALAR